METLFYTYLGSLAISAALTIYVACSLHENDRIFLVATFHGSELSPPPGSSAPETSPA